MPEYDGIAMTMRVNGEDLPEFMIEEDLTQNKVSCWVPSELGKEFSIIAENLTQRNPWGATIKVDGVTASCWAFERISERSIGFFEESPTVIRPFTFSKLELVDDEELPGSALTTHVGEIEIRCQYYQEIESTSSNFVKKFEVNNRMHEKSKKGVTEHIGIGTQVTREASVRRQVVWLQNIVTFVFRYRSLGYLQAQGIAPRLQREVSSPIPSSSQSNKPANRRSGGSQEVDKKPHINIVEDDDEIQILPGRPTSMPGQKRKLDQRAGPSSRKLARGENKTKMGFTPGEVIDLT